MHFVSHTIYRKAADLALREGLAPELFHHHLQSSEFKKEDKYIPIRYLLEIYELSDQRLEKGFSIRQGKQLDTSDYGTVGLSWKTCWQASEILIRLERYMILLTSQGSIRIENKGSITILHLQRKPDRRGVEMANETSFVMLREVLHEVTGEAIFPIKVCFEHDSRDGGLFENYFQCPVHFNSAGNSLHFMSADLEIKTTKADKNIYQFLLERMEEESEGIQQNQNKLVQNIQNLIRDALPSGIPNLIETGAHMGMSARTLKRRLSEEGMTFRDLTQKMQQEIAVDLLEKSDCSIAEIAFQTGFSEQSAFNRAFKRWTGKSPAEFRKEV